MLADALEHLVEGVFALMLLTPTASDNAVISNGDLARSGPRLSFL